ncbi:MAG: GAF domain-containing protein [Anaerolineae bacterium]|nr:GAF domain-containing protein [Anaerolineae bacterium]
METIHLLLIDDAEPQRYLVEGFLSQSKTFQSQVTWVPSLAEAARAVRETRFDLCLLDYDLGSETALDVLALFRGEGITIPVVVLTGYGSHEVDMAVMRAGAFDYLDKAALNPDILERSVRYTIRQARATQAQLEAEQRQRVLAESLLDSTNALNSSLDFDEVLARIIDNLRRVIPNQCANVMMIDKAGYSYLAGPVEYANYDEPLAPEDFRFPISQTPTLRTVMETRQPLIIPDVLESPLWTAPTKRNRIRAYLAVPLIEDDEVIGFINLDSPTPSYFNIAHTDYLRLFANQAVIAIRNARAYQQAQALAALEERQRLARDLHDVVSQTLFSASVTADALTRMNRADFRQMRTDLETLAQLNRSALAEMRALLVELRPQAIVSIPLPELMRNLVNGLRGRSSAAVEVEVIGNPFPLQPDIHQHFYRLMQELLTNAYRHAQATEIRIGLHYLERSLDLVVADDGVGFDLVAVQSQHNGLRTMHERVAKIGASIQVDSAPDEGTYIHISWPLAATVRA